MKDSIRKALIVKPITPADLIAAKANADDKKRRSCIAEIIDAINSELEKAYDEGRNLILKQKDHNGLSVVTIEMGDRCFHPLTQINHDTEDVVAAIATFKEEWKENLTSNSTDDTTEYMFVVRS